MYNKTINLGQLLKQQRLVIPMTLQELARASGVSSSHLGRIERGERFPSAQILRRIAKPLGFEENELFTLAGYLTPRSSIVAEPSKNYNLRTRTLDPWVARTLAQEPVEVQRAAVSLLAILKTIAQGLPPKEKTEKAE